MSAMDNEVITQTKADQEILSFDVSDELLERAATAKQGAYIALAIGTVAACHSSALTPAAWRYSRQSIAPLVGKA
jgi:hypothetical protein